MSNSGSSQREWRCYLHDMIEFSEKIISYTNEIDYETFVIDTLVYDATLRNVELIGEAAAHIPADVRSAHQEIS